MVQHENKINTEACVGCGLCGRDCPLDNICVLDKKAVIKEQDCIKCGHCVAVCPKGAMSMTNFDAPPLEYQKQVVLDPRQLMQAIQTRRSVRYFTEQEIPDEIIQQIIEAGRYTPCAENIQNVSYIVLKNEIGAYEKKALSFFNKILPLARFFIKGAKDITLDEHFTFKNAPVAIVVVSGGMFGKVNGSLAASNMALMAEAHGLGLFYNGYFTLAANFSRTIKKSLGLRPKEKVVMTLVLGYPDVRYYRTAQRERAVVVYK